MAKIVAIGYQLTHKHRDLIARMLKAIDQEAEVVDLQSYKLEVNRYPKNTIFLVFGARAQRITANTTFAVVRYFPELELLEPERGDNSERAKAWQVLQEIRDLPITKEENTIVTEGSVPEFTADQVRELEYTLKQIGVDEWVGKTKDGQSIRLTLSPKEKGQEKIQMTFSELYAIKMAMEILQVKEIAIAYRSESSNKRPSDHTT